MQQQKPTLHTKDQFAFPPDQGAQAASSNISVIFLPSGQSEQKETTLGCPVGKVWVCKWAPSHLFSLTLLYLWQWKHWTKMNLCVQLWLKPFFVAEAVQPSLPWLPCGTPHLLEAQSRLREHGASLHGSMGCSSGVVGCFCRVSGYDPKT